MAVAKAQEPEEQEPEAQAKTAAVVGQALGTMAVLELWPQQRYREAAALLQAASALCPRLAGRCNPLRVSACWLGGDAAAGLAALPPLRRKSESLKLWRRLWGWIHLAEAGRVAVQPELEVVGGAAGAGIGGGGDSGGGGGAAVLAGLEGVTAAASKLEGGQWRLKLAEGAATTGAAGGGEAGRLSELLLPVRPRPRWPSEWTVSSPPAIALQPCPASCSASCSASCAGFASWAMQAINAALQPSRCATAARWAEARLRTVRMGDPEPLEAVLVRPPCTRPAPVSCSRCSQGVCIHLRLLIRQFKTV